ncbi:MAG: FtsW/RodA/SpoVE family cell cycle protein [Planctomycetes bacterium]|nr:FtsW/RodA/SpoVE family cell cycle protein [Planctomycetota bacterium]
MLNPTASTKPGAASALAGMMACIVALAAIGVVAGVSAARPGDGWSSLSLHSGHLIIALFGFLISYALPSERMRSAAPGLLFLVFLILVAMLFTTFGHSSHNAERWIPLGPISMQPSVLLQCLWPVAMATWAARDPLRLTQPLQLTKLMGGFGILVLPVLLQPDLGSVLILIMVTGITLFFAGVSVRFLRVLVPATVGILVAAAYMFDHVSSRLVKFWQSEADFQVSRGLEAFATGGLAGRGPGHGELKFGWVPEGNTDFIFALIAEEWGLFGTGAIWLLFAAFTVFGVIAARRAECRYGAILTAAATVMISVQAALNMAVVTGIAPPKGLPLPFVSRGGTSVLALSALLGLAVKACLDKRKSQVPVEEVIPWTESSAAG